jgi:chitodextrinase
MSGTRYDVHRGTVLRGATEDTFFEDSDLAASTSYNYRVRACDAAENCSAFSDWVSVTTDGPDPSSPGQGLQITALEVNHVGWCSEVAWLTDRAADSLVEYGTAPSAMNRTVYQIALTVQHRVRLAGLSKKTEYYFRATSVDGDGDASTSGVSTFESRPNSKC